MHPPEKLSDHETASELRAALEARRELGPGMDDLVLEAFLARLEERIDARVKSQVEIRAPRESAKSTQHKTDPAVVLGTSMGTGIPLMVIAGIWGGAIGIAATMAGIVLINLMWVLLQWREGQ